MMHVRFVPPVVTLAAALLAAGATGPAVMRVRGAEPALQGQQQSDVQMFISRMRGGERLHMAIPDFVVQTPDPALSATARTIAQVLADDITFEAEFDVIPAASYAAIPAAATTDAVPYDRWHELGADLLVFGTLRADGKSLHAELRVLDVANRRVLPSASEAYDCAGCDPRLYAHKMADHIHKVLALLDGVAQTHIVFTSDRDGERMATLTGLERLVKEIYVADYDGANQHQITANRSLNITPVWIPPDDQAVSYVSYSTGVPQIVFQRIYGQVGMSRPLHTPASQQTMLPAWSPDGSKIAYTTDSDGDGLFEIWIANRDGSNPRRLTQKSGGTDEGPAFSPDGAKVAFTSDRVGASQIYVINADGTGLQRITYGGQASDRPTWSPDPTHPALVFAQRTSSVGNDIMLFDFATRETRQLTNGEGNNESPCFAPNGRHVIFVTTRWGKSQLAEISIAGGAVKRLQMPGNNTFPNWGHLVHK